MDSLRYVFSSKCTYSWFIGMFLHNSKLGSITLFGPLHSVPNFCLFRLLAKPRQAMSVYTPVKHRPEWYWKEVFERRGIEAPGSSGYEDGSGVVVGGRKPTGQKNPKDTWKVANLKLFLQMCFFTSLHTSDVYMYNMYIYILFALWWCTTRSNMLWAILWQLFLRRTSRRMLGLTSSSATHRTRCWDVRFTVDATGPLTRRLRRNDCFFFWKNGWSCKKNNHGSDMVLVVLQDF